MKPKMYMIALDFNSQSYNNANSSGEIVLQILSKEQIELIQILGKRSASKFDKHQFLKESGRLINWQGFEVLKESGGFLHLKKEKVIDVNGDHAVFIYSLIKSKTLQEHGLLSFQDLIKSGQIL